MAYPSRADYTQAVRDYPHISILDSKLSGGAAKRGPNNQLESISGGFSIVFPFKVGANTFALRCWIRDIEDVEARYQEISNYLKQKNLPYFVEFEYIPEGILVNGTKRPITRMEWAEGETLCQFIKNNLNDARVLRNTASEFAKMVETLHAHQISHGDLQDGNILLKRNGPNVEIKLIDYDSLFVPALQGSRDRIFGIAEYQHPKRMARGGTANKKVDYFSELVIYLSLIALAEKSDLWNQFGQRTEKALLFTADDFKNPNQSNVFRELENLSLNIKRLASKLKRFCEKPSIDQLEPLETLLLRSDPSAKAACERGRDFLRSKRYTAALAEFEKAIRIDSKSMEAHLGLGIAYLQMNNLESARRKAEEALRIDANYQPALEVLEAVKRKQSAFGSNLTGSSPSPSPTSQHASSKPTHQKTSDERSLRRHYFYRGLVVVGVICVAFVLVLNSKNGALQGLKGKLSETESQFASLENDNNTLRKKNTGLLNEKRELQGKLSEKDTQLTSVTRENRKLRDEILGLRRQDRDLEDRPTKRDTRPTSSAGRIQPGAQRFQNVWKTFSGHTNWVRSLAFSPNGRTIASGSGDGTIRLWNVATGLHNRTLKGHSAQVTSVAFSPNGRTLTSTSEDNAVHLWNVVTRTHNRTLKGHTTFVRSVAFSPDGQTLASGSADATIRLWNVATGTYRRTLAGHTDWVNSVAFSPDGAMLASGSADATIRLWNVATGTHTRTLAGHTDWVNSVAFSPDGAMLASGSADATIRLWNVTTGTTKWTLKGHADWVRSVVFSPDGKALASASDDRTIRLWSLSTGKHKRTLTGHTGQVFGVTFSPDGTTLASASADRTIRLWH